MIEIAHLVLIYCNPITRLEPFVVFDVSHAIFEVAESFGQIHLQQVLEQVLEFIREVWWEFHLKFESYNVRKIWVNVIVLENALISKDFKDKNPCRNKVSAENFFELFQDTFYPIMLRNYHYQVTF